ncbi:FAD dependent oxidoreductase [Cercophora newfieldiana]|uniref:FAD dependent oxidoreductase n=1 Tax=Cercophora newfieldiana TaxID=92897 RepID=A0AA40CRS0_9PEZI|nr:FAD dependent oxidoreductase [Cercophora newfieldiana]
MAGPLRQVTAMTNAQGPTVILGAGIIGLSTAYHLALALRGQNNPILVADPSSGICLGASGQCEGALGEFGFDEQVQPLGKLSYKLYSELAARAKAVSGHAFRSVGYSPLIVHTVFSHKYDPSNPRLPYPVAGPEELSKLPSWLRVQDSWKGGLINDGSTAARVDPPTFCHFLQDECEKLGVEFLTYAEAVRIDQQAGEEVSTLELRIGGSEIRQVACRNLIISAGSWSPALFSRLFPSVDINLRLAPKQHVQTWLRFSAEDATDGKSVETDAEACHQVWLSPLDENDDIHISSFTNGELYAAGALERVAGKTPPLPENVQPSPKELDELEERVRRYVYLDKRRMLNNGKAFMPAVPQGRPIMDRVPPEIFASRMNSSKEGHSLDVFLSFGHDLDGFTLGLGSGKVMAELLLAEESSIDMSPFKLPLKDQRQAGLNCTIL